MDNILNFKNKLIKENKKGLALDIDETLSWTLGLWAEKMMEKLGNPENLSVRELIAKYRYAQNVPYWQNETANKIIQELTYSNEIQEELPLIENSNRVVQEINKIVPIIAYITVRPDSVVGGTKKWLLKHGFPEAEIIGRPIGVTKEQGNQWKAGVLENLYPWVMGIVDDNPGLTDFLSKDYKGTIFLYDNIETKRQDIKVIPCKTWDHVDEAVKKSMMNGR